MTTDLEAEVERIREAFDRGEAVGALDLARRLLLAFDQLKAEREDLNAVARRAITEHCETTTTLVEALKSRNAIITERDAAIARAEDCEAVAQCAQVEAAEATARAETQADLAWQLGVELKSAQERAELVESVSAALLYRVEKAELERQVLRQSLASLNCGHTVAMERLAEARRQRDGLAERLRRSAAAILNLCAAVENKRDTLGPLVDARKTLPESSEALAALGKAPADSYKDLQSHARKMAKLDDEMAVIAPVDKPIECTGGTAAWCPIHGLCICDRGLDMDNPKCPLHGIDSSHADDKKGGG